MVSGRRYRAYVDRESSSDSDNEIPLTSRDSKFRHRPEFCSRDFSAIYDKLTRYNQPHASEVQLIRYQPHDSEEKENVRSRSSDRVVDSTCAHASRCPLGYSSSYNKILQRSHGRYPDYCKDFRSCWPNRENESHADLEHGKKSGKLTEEEEDKENELRQMLLEQQRSKRRRLHDNDDQNKNYMRDDRSFDGRNINGGHVTQSMKSHPSNSTDFSYPNKSDPSNSTDFSYPNNYNGYFGQQWQQIIPPRF